MADKAEAYRLSAVVTGVLHALVRAKHMSDLESARLADLYAKEKALSSFAVPAFAFAEIEVELRFAVEGPAEPSKDDGGSPDLNVIFAPSHVMKLEAHQMCSMKLKVTPTMMRIVDAVE